MPGSGTTRTRQGKRCCDSSTMRSVLHQIRRFGPVVPPAFQGCNPRPSLRAPLVPPHSGLQAMSYSTWLLGPGLLCFCGSFETRRTSGSAPSTLLHHGRDTVVMHVSRKILLFLRVSDLQISESLPHAALAINKQLQVDRR